MEFLVSCFLCLLLFMCVYVLVQVCSSITSTRSRASSSKLPPGPRRIPILGNLLDLGDKPHKSLAELAKTHGPIMSLKLGNLFSVVISSAAMAREILQTNDLIFSNRTIVDAIRARQHHELGMPWIPVSPLWRNLRKQPSLEDSPTIFKAGADVEVCGFTVPNDAQLLINIWAIHRDPSIGEMPNCFMPGRFLGSAIDVKGRDFELIPFGAGGRICPGLPLA
ncbi:hypothetical protein SLEP1_g8768 [Rubroshorea leprosula]|uniref:Cytochrome P450 n=1 Tax=Rubroshorea leprosula TaxID=152421 RepID=A0AAV5IAP2_9ROSI|nr:hypothetical protein SLEP1_g8768 [Rubroshorea leprosula]